MYTVLHLLRAIKTKSFLISSSSTTNARKNESNSFEDRIKDYIQERMPAFVASHFRGLLDKETLAQLKEANTDTIDSRELKTWMAKQSVESFYVAQPFGSQCYPDFIIVYQSGGNIKVLYIECKSSQSDKARWNCSMAIPQKYCLYLHHNTRKDVVYVALGSQLSDRKSYQSYLVKKKEMNTLNKDTVISSEWKVGYRIDVISGPSFTEAMVDDALEYLSTIAEDTNIYSSLTKEYLDKKSKEERRPWSQFFTPYPLIGALFSLLTEYVDIDTECSVCEPSAGTGQFLTYMRDKLPHLTKDLDAVEIDPELADKLREMKLATIHNCDFLTMEPGRRYNLIVGNPPYAELGSSEYKSANTHLRYNMYGLFIEKAVDLLEDDGVLAFIVPNALRNAPTYSKLRKWLHERGKVIVAKDCGAFSEDTTQDVMVFIYIKTKEDIGIPSLEEVTGDSVIFRDGVEKKIAGDKIYLSSLADIRTGSIVWNQVKGRLHDEYAPGRKRLIYSSDIAGKKITNPDKKPYVETEKPGLELPVLLVTRGKSLECKLYTEAEEPIIAENHVNVIHADLDTLLKIEATLRHPRFQDYFGDLLSTNSISITTMRSIYLLEPEAAGDPDDLISAEKLDKSRGRGGYTKTELEAFCRCYRLPVSGSKGVLVDRLLEYLKG